MLCHNCEMHNLINDAFLILQSPELCKGHDTFHLTRPVVQFHHNKYTSNSLNLAKQMKQNSSTIKSKSKAAPVLFQVNTYVIVTTGLLWRNVFIVRDPRASTINTLRDIEAL